jgi:HAD superfamily hydrolase (TIGR01490 family)
MTRQGFALFDFDGTIIKGDSILACIRYALKTGFASYAYLPGIVWAYAAYGLKIKNDTQAKEAALAFLKGKTAQKVSDFAESFCREVLGKRLFPSARAEIESCKSRGLRVLMVTASPDFYLKPLTDMLGLDGIIGTRADVTPEGVYTGRIAGLNCRGMEKPLRIAEYLAAGGYELDTENSYAYGDSGSDWHMMTLVSHPVAVNAQKKLLHRCGGCRKETWSA